MKEKSIQTCTHRQVGGGREKREEEEESEQEEERIIRLNIDPIEP